MAGITDALLKALTNRTRQQLQDDVSLGKASPAGVAIAPDGSNLDKGVHALASYNIAKKFGPNSVGPIIADLFGTGKEMGDIFGEGDFDMADLSANAGGVLAAQREASLPPVPPREGYGLQGAKISPREPTYKEMIIRALRGNR